MVSLRRISLVILIAAAANALLSVTVFRDMGAVMEGALFTREYWLLPPFWLFVWVWLFSVVFSAAGLTLLLAVCCTAIPHRISGVAAKLAFVLGGAVLGYVVFGLLLFESALPALFGAVAALVFAALCPDWFEPWDEAPLAEE